VINLHSSKNLGDAAITVETVGQLRANFPDARITLAMNDPPSHPGGENLNIVGSFKSWVYSIDEDRREHWHVLAFPYNLFCAVAALITHRLFRRPLFLTRNPDKIQVLQAYFDADLVISCGGNVLYTKRHLAVSFFWIVFATLFAYYAGKPLYMFPQSVGPFVNLLHRRLARFVLSRLRVILVRDELSLQLVKTMALPHIPCHQVPDAAFGLCPGSLPTDATWLRRSEELRRTDTPQVGITTINWGGQNPRFGGQVRYEEALVELIRYITAEMGGHVFLFTQVLGPSLTEDDSRVARRLLDRMTANSSRITYVDAIHFPSQLMAAYGCMDFVVGTRMHSNIFALCAGVPVIAIGYMSKTRGIMCSLELEEWTRDIETVNGPDLVTLFRCGWEKRREIVVYLQTCIPKVRRAAKRAGSLIARDWRSLQEGKG
jgi:colanic acid/amylovoran biosynthesis protein